MEGYSLEIQFGPLGETMDSKWKLNHNLKRSYKSFTMTYIILLKYYTISSIHERLR